MKSFAEAMELTRTISSSLAFDDDECRALWDLLISLPPRGTMMEIGCQLGRSSSLVLQAAKEIGFYPVFVDPWTVQHGFMQQWMEMAHKIGTPFTVEVMRSSQCRNLFHDNQSCPVLDMLLIDGDHTRQGVCVDTLMTQWLKVGGILCAHDYGRESLPDVYDVLSSFTSVPPGDPDWKIVKQAGTLAVWRRVR